MEISIDAEDGHWTALPNKVMEIPMSDGAFRLLTLLCRHADREGSSFPSLQRLATLMGKSKASVSSHLGELRDLGLVKTEKRIRGRSCLGLLFVVTFWRQWRRAIEDRRTGTAPVQDTKAPVQPAERFKKNHIHNNHTTADPARQTEPAPLPRTQPEPMVISVVSDLINEWNSLARGCQWPSFNAEPSRELVVKTRKQVERAQPIGEQRDQLSADNHTLLRKFWKQLGVDVSEEDLATQTQIVGTTRRPSLVIERLTSQLRATWKPHWRKPSSPHHLKRIIDEIARQLPPDPSVQDKALSAFLKRYEAASRQRSRPDYPRITGGEIAKPSEVGMVEGGMRC